MTKKLKAFSIVGILIFIGLIGVFSYIAANDAAARHETGLKKSIDNSKNILSQATNKVIEIAQVPEKFKKRLMEVIEVQLKSRYGENGQQAMVSFMQEHNLPYTNEMDLKIMQAMEARRDDFQRAQTETIDRRENYSYELQTIWTGRWMKWAGWPKMNLDEIVIVTDESTEEAFKTGVSKPLELP